MESILFAVVDEPYCLVESSIRERNEQFLSGLDPDYFDFVFRTYMEVDDEKRAMVALQMSLHHANEVMFSLLGALIQAPYCAYAWIGKCSSNDLREIIRRVNNNEELLNRYVGLRNISWEVISKIVMSAYQPGTTRQTQMIQGFADFWRHSAYALIDAREIEQYNALKHGFRVQAGGFRISIANEDPVSGKPGVAQSLGGSEFGASFFKLERISGKDKFYLSSRRTSVNWMFERVALQLQLVAMSIRNAVSALMICNGGPPGTCQFKCPQEVVDFERPWQSNPGVISASFEEDIDEAKLPILTREDVLKRLRKMQEDPAG